MLLIVKQSMHPPASGRVLPVVDEEAILVYLVLQGEVEGEVLQALVAVDLHPGGVLVGLEVLDDVGEPHRESVVPVNQKRETLRLN